MKAMLLRTIAPFAQNPRPLAAGELPKPRPGPGEVLVRVMACGVCHTELDEIEGRTPPAHLPVVLGHQVVGVIEEIGEERNQDLGRNVTTKVVTTSPSQMDEKQRGDRSRNVMTEVVTTSPRSRDLSRDVTTEVVTTAPKSGDLSRDVTTEVVTTSPTQGGEKQREDLARNVTTKVVTTSPSQVGERVGVAWIFSACGKCEFCRSGRENLCPDFQATGRDANGGYAEYMTVRADFVHPIPGALSDSEAAPLLCAGAVGYRALRLANLEDGQSLGLSGFGASNHLVLKAARAKYPNSKILVFSRNDQERHLAAELGAAWAGSFDDTPPEEMEAIIDATPAWKPVLTGLKHLAPGGRLVINAIRKEEIDRQELLTLDYPSQLWLEKEIKSAANVTRQDVREFLQLAAEAGIKPEFQEYELEDANRALQDVKQCRIRGAKVLRVAQQRANPAAGHGPD